MSRANPDFQFKAGCCVYVRNDITCSCAHALESSEFSTIWLRLDCHSTTKFFCAVYCSPNSSDYVKFLKYFTSKVEYISTNFPLAKISIHRDFNIHHQLFSSFFNDQPGEQVILHDLEQLVQHRTHIPDRSGDTPNIFNLFFTSNPFTYSVKLFSPLDSSDYCLISPSCLIAPVLPQDTLKRRCF